MTRLARFSSAHLLAWLETLGVIGRIDMAYPSLDRIYRIIVSNAFSRFYLEILITAVVQ